MYALYEDRPLILHAFRSRIFLIKKKQIKGLRIIRPTETLQRLPIALA